MLWKKIVDDTWNYKVHFVSAENFDLGCAYLRSKGAVPITDDEDKSREELHFEPGGYGMRSMNMPNFHFDFLGRKIIIDADKVEEMINELYLAGPSNSVEFGNKKFYFVISRFSVLMLDKEERAALIPQLEACRKEAEAVAEEFNKDLEKRLAEIPGIVRVKPKISPETAN